jgi:hypothetical protein
LDSWSYAAATLLHEDVLVSCGEVTEMEEMRTSGSYDQRHFIGKANERTKITDVPAEATQTERANAIILSSVIFGYKICACIPN